MSLEPPSREDLAKHAAIMGRMSAMLDDLLSVIPRRSKIVYIDYPIHFNVGDLLIHWGTERFFSRAEYQVSASYSIFDLCRTDSTSRPVIRLKNWVEPYLAGLDSETIVVFHGGGNFGDLYPHHQALREAVIKACPSRRLVLLPQSIHFDDPVEELRSLSIFSAHPDLHAFLRDQPSLEVYRRVVPRHAALLPDMAFALWELLGIGGTQASSGPLEQQRVDMEATSPSSINSESMDWSDLLALSDKIALLVIRKGLTLAPRWFAPILHSLWKRRRDRVLKRATELFTRHNSLVTDRLHGLILACLLNRPVSYRDNSYGKLSRFADAWLRESPLVTAQAATEESSRSKGPVS